MKKEEGVKEKQRERWQPRLHCHESFFNHGGFQTSRSVLQMYSSFMYEASHNMSLGISKMIRVCLFAYVSSGGLVTGRRKAVLWGCNLLLSAIKRKAGPRR